MGSLRWTRMGAPCARAPMVLVICILCCSPTSGAQEDRGPLEFEMKAVPTEIVPGVPVAVEIRVTNRRDQPIEIFFPFSMQDGLIELFVTGPDGNQRKVPRGAFGESYEYTPLPGKSSRKVREWILPFRKGSLFTAPGSYTIQGRVCLFQGDGWSDLPNVVVEVREPTEPERKAAALFKDAELWGLLKEPLQEGIQYQPPDWMRQLADSYPKTPYGKYARYLVATLEAGPAFPVGTDQGEREQKVLEDLRGAVRRYLDLLSDGPPAPLRAELELALGLSYLRLGEREKALYHQRRLEKEELPFGLDEYPGWLKLKIEKLCPEDGGKD